MIADSGPAPGEAMPDPTRSPAVLEVRDLSVDFVVPGRLPARAVEKISFQLAAGQMMGLVGESGCGKTTLALALMRLLPAAGRITGGQVVFSGRDLLNLSEQEIARVRWKEIAMVFQGAMNALNPVRTVGWQIAEAIARHLPQLDRPARQRRVGELLTLVGIAASRKDHYPHQFSGGQRQRAMIAMALACEPKVIIADEPTTALDAMIQAQILELFAQVREELGLAILLVTHDLGVVAQTCDAALVMYGGVTAEYAPVEAIFNDPRHPYTQALLEAFPNLSQPSGRLAAIPGQPPQLDALPPGCRFAPRCPAAFARCGCEPPRLHRLGPAHLASCHRLEAG